MRNSFPGGLAIGSHKDWSSQGHLPFTVAEKLPQNRRTSDKNLPAMTKEALTEGTNSRSEREFGTWKRGNQVSCHVFIMWFGKHNSNSKAKRQRNYYLLTTFSTRPAKTFLNVLSIGGWCICEFRILTGCTVRVRLPAAVRERSPRSSPNGLSIVNFDQWNICLPESSRLHKLSLAVASNRVSGTSNQIPSTDGINAWSKP